MILNVKGQGHTLNIVQEKTESFGLGLNFGTLTCYGKRMTPFDFQGQMSKVKVT